MLSNIEKYKKDIQKLIETSEAILKKMKDNKNLAELRQNYEIWYSESYAVIKIILPDRVVDFSKMYYDDKIKKGLKIHFQYTPPISSFDLDSWGGIPAKEVDIAKSIFDSQIGILKS